MIATLIADTSHGLPRIEIGQWITDIFTWFTDNLSALFDVISAIVGGASAIVLDILEAPNPIVMVVIFALIGLLFRGWQFALSALVGLLLIVGMAQWQAAMQTLALVLVSTVVAVIIAVPLGILAARSRRASSVIRPFMDLLQTMPAFVWLVPVVTLFGIGYVPGIVATIIFALPPGVRFTELGIRNVDGEIVEAANAFGATPRQTLFGVQLPLAMPTIMAGINQVIMLALSMAVIAGLVGAEGLGGEVASAISTLDLGLGFEAGLSVVFLAIFLDRVTSSFGEGQTGGLLRRIRSLRRGGATVAEASVEEEPEEEAAPGQLQAPAGA